MKTYKVSCVNKDYYVKAQDSVKAVNKVKKLKDADSGSNYQKYWSGDGTVYSQTYNISRGEYSRVLNTLEKEKPTAFAGDSVYGSYDALKKRLNVDGSGVIYPGTTAAKYIAKVLSLNNFRTDRNVRFVIKDSAIKDERLSPMTYRKLKEYGYNSDKWKNLTQEQANKIVQQHENKQSTSSAEKKPEETKKVTPGYTKEYFETAYSEKELGKFDESGLATFYLNMDKQREKYIDKYKQSGKAPNKTELSKRADLLFDVMGRAEKVLRNKWGYTDKDFEALENENGMYARTKAEREQETKNKEQKQGKNKYGVERSMLGTPQHAKAVDCLDKLDIYKPYIRAFRESGRTCFFENYGGYYTDQEPEIFDKQQEIEKEYGCQVFAITHDFTEMGEMYSFLIVPKDEDEWKYALEKQDRNTSTAYAYVWNKDNPDFSEFGDIAVRSFGGGIKRVG